MPWKISARLQAASALADCRARLHSHPHDTIWRFADLLQVNPETVRRWTFARLAIESVSESAHHETEAPARSLAP